MRHFLFSLSALALIIATAGPTHAQTSLFDIPESEQDTFADLGVAALVRETYVGSGQSETGVLPYINAQYKGRFFVNPGLGAGAYAIRKEGFRLAGSLHYSLGRDGIDTPVAEDAFDLEGGFAANLSSRIYTPFAAIDVIGSAPLSGDLDGFRVDTLVTTQFEVFDNKLRVTPGVRATYHSGDYLDSLYGISEEQTLSLPPSVGLLSQTLSFDSEVSTLGAHIAGYYDLNDTIQLVGIVNYSRLIGDVRDTRLAPQKDGLTAAFAIARKF